MRSAAPSDPLAELIEQRRRELRQRIPAVVVPRCFSASGIETLDEFLGIGMPLYVDAIVAQIRAPIEAEQAASSGPNGKWYRTDAGGVVEIELLQPKGALDGANPGLSFVAGMAVPVYEREPLMRLVRSDGNQADPSLPLIARVRVVWPNKLTPLPSNFPVHVDVTVLFAATAEPRKP